MKNDLRILIEKQENNFTKLGKLREQYKNRFINFKDIKNDLEKVNEHEKQTNKLNDDIEVLHIENKIINNNIDYICNNIVINDLIPLLHKYDNKKIGDKTKEKIREQLKNYCLEKYNIQCNFWYKIDKWVSTQYVEIGFTFSKKDSNYYVGKISNLEYHMNITIDNNNNINYNFYGENTYNKNYVENVEKQAKKYYCDRKAIIEKVNKETQKLNNIIENYNKFMNNNLSNDSIKTIEEIY